ncbi:MAG: hypothetical protein O3B04_06995 [Chloroflexi bacterium]|nr:hypothetical protein [Chloroflexota bacterium]MDA1297727.1 hypothetical protein [Chloroflexota bacterium]
MTIRTIDGLKLTGIMLAVLIAAVACTSPGSSNQQDPAAPINTGNTGSTSATATPAGDPAGSDTGSAVTGETAAEASAKSATAEAAAAVEQVTGVLFLEMLSPVTDELFVTQSTYEFTGRTTVDAVLSVNDTVLEVDEEGRFAFAVDLEEGPNVIEVVASNARGEQFDEVLLVIYEPA